MEILSSISLIIKEVLDSTKARFFASYVVSTLKSLTKISIHTHLFWKCHGIKCSSVVTDFVWFCLFKRDLLSRFLDMIYSQHFLGVIGTPMPKFSFIQQLDSVTAWLCIPIWSVVCNGMHQVYWHAFAPSNLRARIV